MDGEEVVRGNTSTMAPGDRVPFGADWCAVEVDGRLVLYVTHRDGTQLTETFTHPAAISALRRTIAMIRPQAEAVPVRLSVAAD